jgi:hypothetical protein
LAQQTSSCDLSEAVREQPRGENGPALRTDTYSLAPITSSRTHSVRAAVRFHVE